MKTPPEMELEAEVLPGAARPAPPRRRIEWVPILLEAGFVVLGVVLALAANEWRQGVRDRRHAATALAGIREELMANREAVHAALTYHLGLSDSLWAAQEAARVPSGHLFSRGFISPATLLQTAWEAAAATDAIGHMPYADVLALARIYEQQRGYAQQAETAGALIYRALYEDGFGGILANYANVGSLVSTFWYRECQLARQYDAVLAQVGAPPGAEASGPPLPPPCGQAARGR